MPEKLVTVNLPAFDDISVDYTVLQALATMILERKPRVIAEAGTYRGHFIGTVHKLDPAIRIYTADPTRWLPMSPLPDTITYHQGDFEEMLELYKPQIDLAFVDSGPPCTKEYLGESNIRLRHYEAVKKYMNPNSLIVVHDTNEIDWLGAKQIIAEATYRSHTGRGYTILHWEPPDAHLHSQGVRPRGPVQDHEDPGRGLQAPPLV